MHEGNQTRMPVAKHYLRVETMKVGKTEGDEPIID